jgi:hypothetical protein
MYLLCVLIGAGLLLACQVQQRRQRNRRLLDPKRWTGHTLDFDRLNPALERTRVALFADRHTPARKVDRRRARRADARRIVRERAYFREALESSA